MRARYQILTLDRESAEAFVAGPDDVCISIGSPGGPRARLRENFREVLRLSFHDVAGFAAHEIPPDAVPPSATDVELIAAFALRNRDAKRLLVHCEAGYSRSVAVAIAISSKLCASWYFPPFYLGRWRRNKYVHYRALFDAVRAELDRRIADEVACASAATGAL